MTPQSIRLHASITELARIAAAAREANARETAAALARFPVTLGDAVEWTPADERERMLDRTFQFHRNNQP